MKRILMAEDETSIAQSLIEYLREEGYDAKAVSNGQAAVQEHKKSLKSQPYDLILLDIVMPKMSGLEALNAIREEEKLQGVSAEKLVPVIMLTGMQDSWIEDAFKDGCSDYVVKPYDLSFLMSKIKKMLGEKK